MPIRFNGTGNRCGQRDRVTRKRPGFWLFKGYFNLTVGETLRT